MPRARSTQKQPLSKTLKVLRIIATVVITLAISAVVYVLFNLDKYTVQGQMERYLEEKYSRRFHVDQPVHKSSGFAVEGTYVANAYPLDNPELTFEVTKSSRVSNDKYVAALWTTDARTYVDSIIKEAFGYLPEYKLLIATHPGEDGSIKGEVPPFADGIKRYGAQVAVNVTVKSADVVGDRQIAVRAHTVVERLVVMGFGSAAIRYTDSSGTSLTYGVGAAASELEAQPHKTVEEIIREIRR